MNNVPSFQPGKVEDDGLFDRGGFETDLARQAREIREDDGHHRETHLEGMARHIGNTARADEIRGDSHHRPFTDSPARVEQMGGPDLSERPRRPRRRRQEVSPALLAQDHYKTPPAAQVLGREAVTGPPEPIRPPARRTRRGKPTPTPPSWADTQAQQAAAIERDRDRPDPERPSLEDQAAERLPHRQAATHGAETARLAMATRPSGRYRPVSAEDGQESLPTEDVEGDHVDHDDPHTDQA